MIAEAEEVGADAPGETDPFRGSDLLRLTMSYEQVQRVRIALSNRGGIGAEEMKAVEVEIADAIRRELRSHPIWPWLSQYKGLGGVHVARLTAIIGDPHRFPGRVCDAGHYHPARPEVHDEIASPAGPCGITLADETTCGEAVGPPRQGTGVRSLWRYLGLDVDNEGRAPRKRKGVQAHWSPRGKTACLMPNGIADSIVKNRTPVYRDVYDAAKTRITRERGVGNLLESEAADGPALRPFQVDALAKKIAVKAFVGDLLQEMKRTM